MAIDITGLDIYWEHFPNPKILPDWVEWVAMDRSGKWYLYEVKPVIDASIQMWTSNGYGRSKSYVSPTARRNYKDWKKSAFCIKDHEYVELKENGNTVRYIGNYDKDNRPQFENYCPVCEMGPTHMKKCEYCGREKTED